jgi:hypothetical protein
VNEAIRLQLIWWTAEPYHHFVGTGLCACCVHLIRVARVAFVANAIGVGAHIRHRPDPRAIAVDVDTGRDRALPEEVNGVNPAQQAEPWLQPN